VLGLDPSTHTSREPNLSQAMGPRIKPESDR
jgi:hypothetical protein